VFDMVVMFQAVLSILPKGRSKSCKVQDCEFNFIIFPDR
jgi:hypothetical protein